MRKMRRLIVQMILAALAACAMGFPTALSETSEVEYLVRSWDTESQKVVYESKKATATIVNDGFAEDDWKGYYLVNSAVEINKRITISGETHLILSDNGKLTVNDRIIVDYFSTLYIHQSTESSTGELKVKKGINVGGGNSLEVHGGKVDAESEYNNAGIGGAANQAGGNITIYAGTVTATGGKNGAGIGGGGETGGNGGTVIIHGGTVNASGGEFAAGIGGGNSGNGGTVIIYGGTVTAKGGGTDGAGIGGGSSGDGGNITIRGGTVNATGGISGAGIGGGNDGSGGNITIHGGTVNASGGSEGAGIGGGDDGSGGAVIIHGGTVTAQGNNYGAGIGGGNGGCGGTLTVYGGTVTAQGGNYGSGIGGGENGNGVDVTINGGKVTASAVSAYEDNNPLGIGHGFSYTPSSLSNNALNVVEGITVIGRDDNEEWVEIVKTGGDYARKKYMIIWGPVTGIGLDRDAATISYGSSVSLTATFSPSIAYDQTVLWSAEDGVKLYTDEACTVEAGTGAIDARTVYVKGTSAGSAAVTATSHEKSSLSDTCSITVTKATPTVSTVPTASEITVGDSLAKSTLSGGTADTEGTFAWKDSTITPAFSDSESTVYTVVFTPTDTANYNTAECGVTVKVNKKTAVLSYGEDTVSKTVGDDPFTNPLTNGSEVAVTYASSDPSVATVDSAGKVTLLKAGTTVITASFAGDETYARASASYTLTVNEAGVPEQKLGKEDLTEVPEALKEIFSTLAELKQAMLMKLEINGTAASGENTAFYEVKLLISLDGGKTWTEATEENFPAEGITVTLDYPTGTNGKDYDFSVCHMFTLNSIKLGTKAGETETPAVTKTEKGLQFTLKGLSPLAVAWAKSAAPTATAAPTVVPKTGDSSAPALWLGLALIGLIGLGATVLRRRNQR